jgi:hypothetical protein
LFKEKIKNKLFEILLEKFQEKIRENIWSQLTEY